MTTKNPVYPPIEEPAQSAESERYILRLYVAGMKPRSAHAIENIRAICLEHLEGRYELQVIDVYQQPELAKGEQIVAAPTLIKKLPLPLRRIIGDMSNEEKVLVGLGLTRR
jgi:circadian clock protein KaiB